MNLHPVMVPHPAVRHLEALVAVYVAWHRFYPAGRAFDNPAFTRDCLAALTHAVQRVGRQENP